MCLDLPSPLVKKIEKGKNGVLLGTNPLLVNFEGYKIRFICLKCYLLKSDRAKIVIQYCNIKCSRSIICYTSCEVFSFEKSFESFYMKC